MKGTGGFSPRRGNTGSTEFSMLAWMAAYGGQTKIITCNDFHLLPAFTLPLGQGTHSNSHSNCKREIIQSHQCPLKSCLPSVTPVTCPFSTGTLQKPHGKRGTSLPHGPGAEHASARTTAGWVSPCKPPSLGYSHFWWSHNCINYKKTTQNSICMGKKDTPQVLILLGHVRSKLDLFFFYAIIIEEKVA